MNQEILTHLDELAQTVKDISPVVWEAYMKQQYIVGGSITSAFLTCLVILLIGVYRLRTLYDSDVQSEDVDPLTLAFLLAGGISSIVTVIFFLVEGIPRLLNPTYYAIRALIG